MIYLIKCKKNKQTWVIGYTTDKNVVDTVIQQNEEEIKKWNNLLISEEFNLMLSSRQYTFMHTDKFFKLQELIKEIFNEYDIDLDSKISKIFFDFNTLQLKQKDLSIYYKKIKELEL